MGNFINIEDYDASIHREILDALTRDDASLVEICEVRAIAEMRCYLSKRYDCDAIFSAVGDQRNQLVLMMALDIAIYHIFSIHNPQKLSQLRKDRYDRAVEWMRAVADEEVSDSLRREIEEAVLKAWNRGERSITQIMELSGCSYKQVRKYIPETKEG